MTYPTSAGHASDAARFMTGAVLAIDGGCILW
jgi:hypothetical protein